MVSLQKNPFVYQDALTPTKDILVGREKLLDKIIAQIDNQATTVLTGTRFIGKTSILNFLVTRLPSEWRVLRIECLGCTGYDGLVKAIINALLKLDAKKAAKINLKLRASTMSAEQTTEWGSDIKLIHGKRSKSKEEKKIINHKIQLDTILDILLEIYQKEKLVIFFDESHYLNFDKDNVLATLKAHLKDRGISTIFTGSKRRLLTNMFANNMSPYARRVNIIEVENIDTLIFQEYILEKFEQSGKSITSEALTYLFSQVGISPQRVQEVCFYLWQESSPIEEMDVIKVENAIEQVIANNKRYFVNDVKDMYDSPEYELKRNIAEEPLPSLNSREWFNKAELPFTGSLRNQLRKLEQEDEILLTTNGEYRLRDPLFSLWLSRQEF